MIIKKRCKLDIFFMVRLRGEHFEVARTDTAVPTDYDRLFL
jgi:hypothetical protein